MKIAFLNIYQESAVRGVEVFVSEVSSRLSKKHAVDILSGNSKNITRWPLLWRLYLDPNGLNVLFFTLSQIPNILREKHDIVIPLNGGWQVLLIRIVTRMYGGKMVVVGQSGIGWDDRVNLWLHPDTFVCLTKEFAKWAKGVTNKVKLAVIPNGVNTKEFFQAKKVVLNLERPIILSVGALENNKRHELAIKAVAKLLIGSLLIVGKGNSEFQLRRLGNKLLGKSRFLLTSFPHAKMPGVYKSVDLFTFPTVAFESFGIVLIEAMAAGLPTVSNDDPIRREIVGEAGLFVDPGQTAKYTNALETALTINWQGKPEKQAHKFDWEEITTSYEKLFQELVNK